MTVRTYNYSPSVYKSTNVGRPGISGFDLHTRAHRRSSELRRSRVQRAVRARIVSTP